MMMRIKRTLSLKSTGYGLPKPEHRDIGHIPNLASYSIGEDAYFIKENRFGVSDGVGAWRVSNGNSSFVSEMLLHYCATTNGPMSSCLQTAYQKVLSDMYQQGIKGSATVLLGELNGSNLQIASLGDCELIILRDYSLIYRSPMQSHFFNCPYQLGTNSINTPKDCYSDTVPVQKNDIIVCGTDGVFDNLWETDIIDILQSSQEPSKQIVEQAMDRATDIHYEETPFQLKANEEGLYHIGGKLDDTTVIVSIVK